MGVHERHEVYSLIMTVITGQMPHLAATELSLHYLHNVPKQVSDLKRI